MIRKRHHFLILSSRSWPFIISIGAFNSFFSLCLFLKFNNFFNFIVRIWILSIIRFFWWINYRKELNIFGFIRQNLEEGLKFSILLFISSEVFFFFSFFWSYFHFFLSPELEVRFIWPYFSLKRFDPFGVPLLNTFILLSSGFTITLRHFYIIKGEDLMGLLYSFFTVVLGILFSFLQWEEYQNSFFSIRDGSFGSSFFLLTGFHGIHVLIGTSYILLNLCSFKKYSFYGPTMVGFEIAAWYWHFVDVVWIFLYFNLYYFNL